MNEDIITKFVLLGAPALKKAKLSPRKFMNTINRIDECKVSYLYDAGDQFVEITYDNVPDASNEPMKEFIKVWREYEVIRKVLDRGTIPFSAILYSYDVETNVVLSAVFYDLVKPVELVVSADNTSQLTITFSGKPYDGEIALYRARKFHSAMKKLEAVTS